VNRTALILLIATMSAGCATSYPHRVGRLHPIPAHWVDESPVGPSPPDYGFNALSFSSPSDGWIVGDRYLLHISGEDLSVTAIDDTGCWLTDATFTTPEQGWAVGFRNPVDAKPGPTLGPSQGVVWSYSSGKWTASDLAQLDWPNWYASSVFASPNGEAWTDACTTIEGDEEHPPAPKRFKPVLLRSDKGPWEVDPVTRMGDRRWWFHDACFDASADGWFVGTDLSDPNAWQALAVRRHQGEWQRIALPAGDGRNASVSRVQCLPGDRAIAIGTAGDGATPKRTLLFRYNGGWQRIELPEVYSYADVGGFAAPSDSEVWLAASWGRRTL
jgi:hypothetical protein